MQDKKRLVTDLTPQKKNPNRYNLFIDKKFYCGISVNTIARHNIYKDLEYTEAELEAIVITDIEERLFDRCCNYLNRGFKSTFKLRQYLKDVFFKKNNIWWTEDLDFDRDKITESIVQRLTQTGLLNDKVYAEAFIRDKMRFSPKARFAMSQDLFAKGITKEIANAALDTEMKDEYTLLEEAYIKKYKDTEITRDDKKKLDFLRRKGFTWDLITKFIDKK
jgi:regulatory protein